jgi:hypothetical protein
VLAVTGFRQSSLVFSRRKSTWQCAPSSKSGTHRVCLPRSSGCWSCWWSVTSPVHLVAGGGRSGAIAGQHVAGAYLVRGPVQPSTVGTCCAR